MHPAAKRGWTYFGLAVFAWLTVVANPMIVHFYDLSEWYLLIVVVSTPIAFWALWIKAFPLVVVSTLDTVFAQAQRDVRKIE